MSRVARGPDHMPVMFVGHGNPMNAINKNAYASGWESMVEDLPRPEAVLCVSAHWDAGKVMVNTSPKPDTLHDFLGFPRDLYDVVYPCPGSPGKAREAARVAAPVPVGEDHERGLDHGVWAVLKWMYPEADIPVFQMSLDTSRSAAFHYGLGRRLAALRGKGVLVMGSGNIVHNLSMMDMSEHAQPFGWASEFDSLVRELVQGRRHESLIDYHHLGSSSRLAIPTPEHYLPLLTVLGATGEGEPLRFYNEEIDLGSVSMTSMRFGV